MAVDHPQHKIVVIDTNQYAGNFERQMCAFITGQIGDCGVGAELARKAEKELRHGGWFEGNIASEIDDHGNFRPTSMWPSPAGNSCNGVAIFLEEFPPEDVLAEMVERAKQFCTTNRIKYMGCRLLEPHYEIKQVRAVPA
jgi:hypothetical protein